jgi:hypothetical protein
MRVATRVVVSVAATLVMTACGNSSDTEQVLGSTPAGSPTPSGGATVYVASGRAADFPAAQLARLSSPQARVDLVDVTSAGQARYATNDGSRPKEGDNFATFTPFSVTVRKHLRGPGASLTEVVELGGEVNGDQVVVDRPESLSVGRAFVIVSWPSTIVGATSNEVIGAFPYDAGTQTVFIPEEYSTAGLGTAEPATDNEPGQGQPKAGKRVQLAAFEASQRN